MSKYNGLQNEGATCYLNSLIQTLFMTYEFRMNLYEYRHDPKKIKQINSIPFQLQKLFVQLQESKSICQTRGLQKSFQWQEKDAYQQHDVQQFCRILFQAVEKAQKDSIWLSQLYTGIMSSYFDCGKHFRTKHETFMDLSLPIRGFQSLEQSLKNYIKPEQIQQVQCEGCQGRVTVKKGIKFQKLPNILTIQLNRFELNYQTMQREKINSFLYYPQILEMWRFIAQFNNIELKGLPQGLKQQSKIIPEKVTSRNHNFNFDKNQKLPIKRKNSFEKEANKQSVKFLDQQGKNKRNLNDKGLSKEELKQSSKQFFATLQTEKQKIDTKMDRIKAKQLKQIQEDMLFGTVMEMQNKKWNAGSFEKDNDKEKNPSTPYKNEFTYQHTQQVFNIDNNYKDNTYALYAVLVHAGGAYGGHYFSYIFDGVDWFRFDDSKVNKVQRSQIRKYGQFGGQTLHGANAYMLFYRNTKTFRNLSDLKVPQDLLQLVKKDEQIEKTVNNQKQQKLVQLSKNLLIKIYKNTTQFETIMIEDRFVETLGQLKARISSLYNLTESQNWRLRRYNKLDDTMHQVYLSNHQTLDDLGFRQMVYLIVQTKSPDAIFEDYDPHKITIKVNIWRQNIMTLTEQHLQPLKIRVKDDIPFEDLYDAFKIKSGIKDPIIMKRNFSAGPQVKQYPVEQFFGKRLIDLRFFNCMNLYAEEKGTNNWIKQFQTEKYRCQIFYNNPKISDERNLMIYFDTRKTLKELKKQLSLQIDVDEENFRIKKSQNAVAELSAYRKKLSQLRFVNTQYIFIQLGKSSKSSILIRKGEVLLVQERIQFELGAQMQVDIDAQVVTVADLKNRIGQLTSNSPSLIRIREYKAYQFGQIFHNSELLQRIREMSLVWELLTEEDQRGTQVYIRIFDILNMELGQVKELFVDSQASCQEFAFLIQENFGIPSDCVLSWRLNVGYVDKETLLDYESGQKQNLFERLLEMNLYRQIMTAPLQQQKRVISPTMQSHKRHIKPAIIHKFKKNRRYISLLLRKTIRNFEKTKQENDQMFKIIRLQSLIKMEENDSNQMQKQFKVIHIDNKFSGIKLQSCQQKLLQRKLKNMHYVISKLEEHLNKESLKEVAINRWKIKQYTKASQNRQKKKTLNTNTFARCLQKRLMVTKNKKRNDNLQKYFSRTQQINQIINTQLPR